MYYTISKVHRANFRQFFFIAEKTTMVFSVIEMLGRYLRKYGVQNIDHLSEKGQPLNKIEDNFCLYRKHKYSKKYNPLW